MLLLHLHKSPLYDPRVVLAALGPTRLEEKGSGTAAEVVQETTLASSHESRSSANESLMLRERVLLLSRLGSHAEALRILAFLVGDIDACMAYCKQEVSRRSGAMDGGQPNASWLTLLELLLK